MTLGCEQRHVHSLGGAVLGRGGCRWAWEVLAGKNYVSALWKCWCSRCCCAFCSSCCRAAAGQLSWPLSCSTSPGLSPACAAAELPESCPRHLSQPWLEPRAILMANSPPTTGALVSVKSLCHHLPERRPSWRHGNTAYWAGRQAGCPQTDCSRVRLVLTPVSINPTSLT